MKTDRNDRARLAAGAAVMLAAMNAAPALARDCLLDTNNDGVATASTDTDGGAESANQPDRLACGPYANAAASGAVSVGVSSSASGAYSMAAGYLAAAYQRDAIALGNQAEGSSQQAVVTVDHDPSPDRQARPHHTACWAIAGQNMVKVKPLACVWPLRSTAAKGPGDQPRPR